MPKSACLQWSFYKNSRKRQTPSANHSNEKPSTVKMPAYQKNFPFVLLLSFSVLYSIACLIWVSIRPEGVFWTIDEGGKLVFLQNVIREGNIFAPIQYPGRDLDPELEFVPFTYTNNQNGELRTWWLPSFPLAAVPFYLQFGWIGLYILPAAGGAVTLFVSGLIVSELAPQKKWLPILTALLVGFTTPVAFYSVMFWEHMPATAVTLLSLYLVMIAKRLNRYAHLAAAGLMGAIAFSMRTELIFFLIVLGLVLLIFEWRKGVVFGASFLIFCLPFFYINSKIFGHPINVHLGSFATASNFALFSNFGIAFLAYFLFNPPAFGTYPLGEASLALGTAGFLLALGFAFIKRYRIFLFFGLAALLLICTRVLFSSYGYKSLQGFLLCAPFLVFFPFYFDGWEQRRKNLFTWFILFSMILYAVVYLYKAWVGAGGLQWGTRYLLVFYPLITIMVLVGLSDQWVKLSNRMMAGLIVGCLLSFLVGLGFQVRGLRSVIEVMRYYEASRPGLSLLSDRPVVTRFCDPALIMEGKYWEQRIFSATWTGVDAWTEHAKVVGIPSFYVISLDICTSKPLHLVREDRIKNPYGLTVNLYSAPEYFPKNYPIIK
jgi:hypothetical protein